MSTQDQHLEDVLARGYQHGFITDIESDTVPAGGWMKKPSASSPRRRRNRSSLLDWRLRALGTAGSR